MLGTKTVRKLYELRRDAQFILRKANKLEGQRRDCLDLLQTIRVEESILYSSPDGAISPREWKRARDEIRRSKATIKKRWLDSQIAYRTLKANLTKVEKDLPALVKQMKADTTELTDNHRHVKSELDSTVRLVKVVIARIGIQELVSL